MKITRSFTPSSLSDWRNWLAENHDREQEVWLVYFKPASGRTNLDLRELGEAFQKISPSYRRTYILWLSDAKKPETFEKRFKLLIDEVLSGKPTSMH